jgi:thymidylate synthase ThyX
MSKKKYTFIEEVPEEIKSKLSNYITNVGGDTFAIHGLPPELTGGLMARYSRAPTGLQLTLVNEFLDENGNPSQQKGTELMDRVLNAFGDDSVGELENAHVGIEEVSQLLTKEIEDRRIGGSPIEQSTRYVKYDVKDIHGKWRYLRPKEIIESGLGEKFEKVNDRTFELYSETIKKLSEFFRAEFPRESFNIKTKRDGEEISVGEKDLISDDEKSAFNNAYNFTIRCAALDTGRGVLPSSTLTHLGINANGRFYTNLISHLKSGDLEEMNERGNKLERELKKIIPTFVKRNGIREYNKNISDQMKYISRVFFSGIEPDDKKVSLVTEVPYLDMIIASSVFPFTNVSLPQIVGRLNEIPSDKKEFIFEEYIGKRNSRRDRTGRGFEAGYPLNFDLVGGFAEYRDLERHRMNTQQRQKLTTDLGFILPPEIGIIGLEKETEEVSYLMADLNSDLKHAGLEDASQYATLFNNRMRFMFGMNLREFQHLSELRTQPAGHFSYRSMTMEMARQVSEKYPWAEKAFGFVDYSDPGNKISRAKEQSKIAGKNLSLGVDGSLDF